MELIRQTRLLLTVPRRRFFVCNSFFPFQGGSCVAFLLVAFFVRLFSPYLFLIFLSFDVSEGLLLVIVAFPGCLYLQVSYIKFI